MAEPKLNAPHVPSCVDCGTRTGVHAAPRAGALPGTALGHVWLCGSCEYAREHPRAVKVKQTRAAKVAQTETLL